ncbi:MAG: N-acetyltransferase [Gordonia sp.]|nr:N-acetyltransferase [Gordonia sp. (in: high G+C Gram-positive bacteria)]
MTWLSAPVLSGTRVTLRPLELSDVADLAAAVDNPERFRWTTVPAGEQDARDYIQTALDTPDRVAFAVVDQATDRIVGSTSYYDISPVNRALAVGYTWYSAAVQGTTVNPDAKLLLLRRAFEDLGAVRVVWHTDERNAQSRAGIAKLGATFEGLLRKHKPLAGGEWRTTAQFAMTDDDWPAARAKLQERLR